MDWLISILLLLLMCFGFFLLLWAAVGFIQDKRFFSSAPKDIQEVIEKKPERFKGQHALGYILLVLAILLLLGAPIFGFIDGVNRQFGYWMFFARFLILFVGTKLFDMTFFDIYLLCYSSFFPRYYPECKELVGPRQLGFNFKSQCIKLVCYVALSLVLSALGLLLVSRG